MRFVFDRAPNGSLWTLENMVAPLGTAAFSAIAAVHELGWRVASSFSIVIDDASRALIDPCWDAIDWSVEPVSQSITFETELWFVARDRFATSWLTRRLPREELLALGRDVGFDLLDCHD